MASEILTNISNKRDGFSKGQKRIADYIISSYDKAAFLTANKLGKIVNVSESTARKRVERARKLLGELLYEE